MPGLPRIVFVPVSGPGGAGEYYRSLAVARGLERRWPGCRIRFVLNRAAPYAAAAPYEGLRIDDSPTRASREVTQYLRAERPDVAVFDSSGRIEQYRAARAVGARVVYVSSRPKTRWKGFRWRRMPLIDQHWIAQPRFLGGAPTPYERWKLRWIGRPEIVVLDALHEPPDAAAVARLQAELRLEPGTYVVVCPGGGGDFGHATDAAAVFLAAARRLTAAQPLPVVAVLGPRAAAVAPDAPSPGRLECLATLPNGVLLGLLRDARVAVVNGGSLLLQSMAQRVAIVAAPIAGDQADRIRRCARAGGVRASALDAEAIARAATALLDDEPARAALKARLDALALQDGVATATEAVARLLDAPREDAASPREARA
jgi:hypothetical protein